MRRARIKADGAGYYHCMSRIIEKRPILGAEEKEKFRKIMRQVEGFSGAEILTYSVMSSHFLCGVPHNSWSPIIT
jgi:putative transposase